MRWSRRLPDWHACRVPHVLQRMVAKIKKQNEQADDLMEQQDDMIANYKVWRDANERERERERERE